MRLAFGVITAVVGALLAVLGTLQLTLWAPEENVVVTANPGEAPLVVIQPGVLNLYDTPAELTVQGEGEITIAQASKEHVDAWVGDTAHASVPGLAGETQLRVDQVEGEAETAPNPAGADLWTSEVVGEGTAELRWDAEPGRTAFLIATDGENPAAQSITIAWPNDEGTPWAIPLIVIGGLIFLASGWFFYTYLRRAREAARRRAERQQRRRRLAETGTALMVVGAFALAGCGGEPELPVPLPEPEPTEAQPALSPEQTERILAAIAEDVARADEELDAGALDARVSGPARAVREAAYQARETTEEVSLPPAVAADEVAINHVTATDSWPRVTTLVTNSEDPAQTQYLNLIQETPRDNYRLWSQTVLFGGATVPQTQDPAIGAPLLAADQPGLVQTPEEAARNYAAALGDEEAEEAQGFEEDDFRNAVLSNSAETAEALQEGNADFSRSYEAQEGDLVATGTLDGGALVTAYLTSTTRLSPEEEDGRTGSLTLGSPISDLLGEDEVSSPVETTTGVTVTFLVPPAGSEDRISVLGATEVLTGAREVDDADDT